MKSVKTILKLFFLPIILQNGRCVKVIDTHSQQPYSIKYSDYCEGGNFCREGAHVLCLYYDPHHKMGQKCNYRPGDDMVSVTPDLAYLILDIVNAARSRIAKGEEKGRGDNPLPRGYGLFRLKWDNELATFAQLWADQCLDEDNGVCTSSKRFPDAGQVEIFTQVRPDWSNPKLNIKKEVSSKKGLDPTNLKNLVLEMLHTFFVHKRTVTLNEIKHYPPRSTRSYYLAMVNSFTTHMGCGLSTFIDLKYEPTSNNLGPKGGIGRMMMLSCNFSSKRKEGQEVYYLQRPPYTSECGCPVGTKEDSDNLCVEDTSETTTTTSTTNNTDDSEACLNPDANCEPPVVILPIFSVDNAPPEKLVPKINASLRATINSQYESSDSISSRGLKKPCGKKPRLRTKPGRLQNVPQWHRQTRKNKLSSIFTRVKKFKLPGKEKISDVKPRKDFRQVQKLVDDYIRRQNNKLEARQSNVILGKNILEKVTTSTTTEKFKHTTEIILNTSEEKAKLCDLYGQQKINTSAHDCIVEHELKTSQDDDKIMTLLNNLEKEVKHVELDGNTKQVVDAKIRKIYGTVVGKPELHLIRSTPPIPQTMDIKIPSTQPRDINESRKKNKHESNYIAEDDLQRHDIDHFLNNVNTNNIEKYFKKKTEYKHLEDLENKSFNDNDIFNNDHRIYNDIERKYNDRLSNKFSMTEFNQKYYEDENAERHFNHKSSDVISRNQNHFGNYEAEVKYHKYHLSDSRNNPRRDIERHYLRNMEDDRNRKIIDDKRDRKKEFDEDDPLSLERRRYYQDKIENLERRIHSAHFRHSDHDDRVKERHFRRMRPEVEETNVPKTRSKLQGDPFYIPERARFLHGF